MSETYPETPTEPGPAGWPYGGLMMTAPKAPEPEPEPEPDAPVQPAPAPVPGETGAAVGQLLYVVEDDPFQDPPRQRIQVAIVAQVHEGQVYAVPIGYLDQCASYPAASLTRG